MSVTGVAIRATDALVFLDVLVGLITLGLLLAITHVASRTRLALFILEIFVLVVTRSLATIAGCASGALDALVVLDVLVSIALGLFLAVTHVVSRTRLAVIIFEVAGHVAHALRVSLVDPS